MATTQSRLVTDSTKDDILFCGNLDGVIFQQCGWHRTTSTFLFGSVDTNQAMFVTRAIRFDRPVALKIVKSAPHYTETALDEIKLLDKVVSANRSSPERKCVVELLDWFKHRGPHGTRE